MATRPICAKTRHAPTDLNAPDALAAYRCELRGVARWSRLAGFVLVLAALALFVWPQGGGPERIGPLATEVWGWVALGTGWAIWIGVIVARTRYHRVRMAERSRDAR